MLKRIYEKQDKVFLFLEERFIKILMLCFSTLVLLFKVLASISYTNKSPFIIRVDNFLVNDLTNAFIDRDSTLITLAAVFIGIYFTVYTLLATLSGKSSFSLLTKHHLNSLIKYIKNAFIASFAYLLVSLLSPLLISYGWLYSAMCLVLLMYMLLSALRFGLLIYLILKNDVDRFLEQSKEDKLREKRLQRLLHELESYLEEQSHKKAEKKADEMSDFLEKRKNRQDNR